LIVTKIYTHGKGRKENKDILVRINTLAEIFFPEVLFGFYIVTT
jgi:hypothetical protein